MNFVLFQLAQRPTPIHTWNLPGVPDGYHISIKRDDMTGSTLSGNKVELMHKYSYKYNLSNLKIHKMC